jgi:toxin YhaV
LTRKVDALRIKDPLGYKKKRPTKMLAAVTKLALEVIPQDPMNPAYRLGGTLGDDHKHWFRAKFFQQYRLFFRYHASSKTIVLAWVNDETSKRAYESHHDAYKVFRRMLEGGYPPDDWGGLLEQAEPLLQPSPPAR